MNVGELLLSGSGAAILVAFIQAVRDRRKLKADTTAVLTKAAVDLYEPLSKEIKRVRDQATTEVKQVRDDCEAEERRLRSQILELTDDLRWLKHERSDQIRRDQARAAYDRAVNVWINTWLPQARALGLAIPDPPPPPDLAPLLDPSYLDR